MIVAYISLHYRLQSILFWFCYMIFFDYKFILSFIQIIAMMSFLFLKVIEMYEFGHEFIN